jgi:hypothetical protein
MSFASSSKIGAMAKLRPAVKATLSLGALRYCWQARLHVAAKQERVANERYIRHEQANA